MRADQSSVELRGVVQCLHSQSPFASLFCELDRGEQHDDAATMREQRSPLPGVVRLALGSVSANQDCQLHTSTKIPSHAQGKDEVNEKGEGRNRGGLGGVLEGRGG